LAQLRFADGGFGQAVLMRRRPRPRRVSASRSSFAAFRFPPEVITVVRYGLSYHDIEELLAERGIEVDHVTIYRWVQRVTPLLIDAARPCRHAFGARWFVDENVCEASSGKAALASIASVTLRGSCRGAVILCVLDVGDNL
jgi:hypothetical protein